MISLDAMAATLEALQRPFAEGRKVHVNGAAAVRLRQALHGVDQSLGNRVELYKIVDDDVAREEGSAVRKFPVDLVNK